MVATLIFSTCANHNNNDYNWEPKCYKPTGINLPLNNSKQAVGHCIRRYINLQVTIWNKEKESQQQKN